MSELTVEAFHQLYAELCARPPTVIAIWFVDRQAEYSAARARYGHPERTDAFAVRLMEWWSIFATPEDIVRAPTFVTTPGIWAEMSDGTHRRMDAAP